MRITSRVGNTLDVIMQCDVTIPPRRKGNEDKSCRKKPSYIMPRHASKQTCCRSTQRVFPMRSACSRLVARRQSHCGTEGGLPFAPGVCRLIQFRAPTLSAISRVAETCVQPVSESTLGSSTHSHNHGPNKQTGGSLQGNTPASSSGNGSSSNKGSAMLESSAMLNATIMNLFPIADRLPSQLPAER
jgi:hypothetical protein